MLSDQPGAAVLGERAVELRPQGMRAEQQRDRGGDSQADDRSAQPREHGLDEAHGKHHHQDKARDGGVGNHLFAGEQLRGGEHPPARPLLGADCRAR